MSTLYHLLAGNKVPDQVVATQNSVCIAIIDEATAPPVRAAGIFERDWLTFRNQYPVRPYFLIQVNGAVTTSLRIPPTMRDAIINNRATRAFLNPNNPHGTIDTTAAPVPPATVGVTTEASAAWPEYGALGLADASVLPTGMVRDNGTIALRTDIFAICGLSSLKPNDIVFLFVDNSGSMTVAQVRASLDLLQARCNAAGIRILAVSNTVENYIEPFIAFTGTAGVPGAAPGTVPL